MPADALVVRPEERGLVAGTEVRTAGRRFRLDVGEARRVLLRVESSNAASALRHRAGDVLRRLRLRG